MGADELQALWAVYSSFFETDRRAFDEAVRRADELLRTAIRSMAASAGWRFCRPTAPATKAARFVVLSTSAVCVEPAYRGLNAVQQAGLFRLALERVRHPFRDVDWYFDTFSYKSYLLLARNLTEYWPRRDRPTPAWETGVIEMLAQRQAGEPWSATAGIIRSQDRRLRPGVGRCPAGGPDPDIQYFLDRNPGHAAGERLPCLCPLNARNVAAIAWTAIHRVARRA